MDVYPSNGALTAGRKIAIALFPYYTDDKISESGDHTGSTTILLVRKETRPIYGNLSERQKGSGKIQRNLYKNAYGNKVVFEEINHDLGLIFSSGTQVTLSRSHRVTKISKTHPSELMYWMDCKTSSYGVGKTYKNKQQPCRRL